MICVQLSVRLFLGNMITCAHITNGAFEENILIVLIKNVNKEYTQQ